MLRKFTLLTPSFYIPTSFNPSEILTLGATAELCYFYNYDNKETLSLVWAGYKEPFTKEEIAILESGEELIRKEEASLSLPPSSYMFYQVNAALVSRNEIKAELIPLIKEGSGSFYLRYFKENSGDVITQFFFPL